MTTATPYKYGAANPASRHPTETLDYAEWIAQVEIDRQRLVSTIESGYGKARESLIEACVTVINRVALALDERKK